MSSISTDWHIPTLDTALCRSWHTTVPELTLMKVLQQDFYRQSFTVKLWVLGNRIYSVATQVLLWSVVVLIGCALGSIMAAATTSCKTMTPWRQCQPSVTLSGTGSYLSTWLSISLPVLPGSLSLYLSYLALYFSTCPTWLSISLPVLPACTRHFINRQQQQQQQQHETLSCRRAGLARSIISLRTYHYLKLSIIRLIPIIIFYRAACNADVV